MCLAYCRMVADSFFSFSFSSLLSSLNSFFSSFVDFLSFSDSYAVFLVIPYFLGRFRLVLTWYSNLMKWIITSLKTATKIPRDWCSMFPLLVELFSFLLLLLLFLLVHSSNIVCHFGTCDLNHYQYVYIYLSKMSLTFKNSTNMTEKKKYYTRIIHIFHPFGSIFADIHEYKIKDSTTSPFPFPISHTLLSW